MKAFFWIISIGFFEFNTQAATNDFKENLENWLFQKGISASVLDYSKVFDNDNFLESFSLSLKEKQNINLTENISEPTVHLDLGSRDQNQGLSISIRNKNIRGLPYFSNDWISKIIIEMGISRISRLLGLQTDYENLSNDRTLCSIYPASTTQANRLRFEKIQLVYKIEDLVLDLDIHIEGPKDYVVFSFLKGELLAIIRQLESGSASGFFGSRDVLRTSRSSPSDLLLGEFLKVTLEPEFEQKIMNF